MAKNENMHKAKSAKNDEFYTRLEDIENEISMHEDYVRLFQGKTVLCNCDDPEWSNFFLFFRLHFKQLGLKKVIFTHFEMNGSPSYKLEWSGDYIGYDTLNLIRTPLEGNGDFRSPECVALLDECDIVVTNPPFSLFRQFVHLIIDHGKDMVVIGNMNAITYKEIFPLIKENKLALGYTQPKIFIQPDKTEKQFGNILWFTTLDLDKYHEELFLGCKYALHPERYPKYDNYDAINVDKVKEIPCDYDGVMGVPITFLDKYCPEQFEIVNANDYRISDSVSEKSSSLIKDKDGYIRERESNLRSNLHQENCSLRELTDGTSTDEESMRGSSYYDMVARPVADGIKRYRRIFIRRKTTTNNQ